VERLDPIAAIRRLAELTFDHHGAHPDFIRLSTCAARSASPASIPPAIELIASILERGRAAGSFVADVDAVDLHMMISAFCVFRIANRHTFGSLFKRDLTSPQLRDHYRRMLGDMVVAYLTRGRPNRGLSKVHAVDQPHPVDAAPSEPRMGTGDWLAASRRSARHVPGGRRRPPAHSTAGL
jgi:hypothetical protein